MVAVFKSNLNHQSGSGSPGRLSVVFDVPKHKIVGSSPVLRLDGSPKLYLPLFMALMHSMHLCNSRHKVIDRLPVVDVGFFGPSTPAILRLSPVTESSFFVVTIA
jgi:hypothetical protein